MPLLHTISPILILLSVGVVAAVVWQPARTVIGLFLTVLCLWALGASDTDIMAEEGDD